MTTHIVSYYEPCNDPSTPDAVDLYGDGQLFQLVTKPTDDEYLLEAVRLTVEYGGLPWRVGDGVDPDTRYGIKQLS